MFNIKFYNRNWSTLNLAKYSKKLVYEYLKEGVLNGESIKSIKETIKNNLGVQFTIIIDDDFSGIDISDKFPSSCNIMLAQLFLEYTIIKDK